jgi:hypothetical protein
MATPRPSRSSTSDRRADEQKVREALEALTQTERLVALRNVPLTRSVKLGGASRIVLGAAQLGAWPSGWRRSTVGRASR